MDERIDVRWIAAGVVGGLLAAVLYPTLLFAPLPLVATAAVASLLGPAIGLGSLGLRALLRLHRDSVSATVGAISNVLAGALFSAMALVQLAVRSDAIGASGAGGLVGVWLGLDVAWDVYVGLGTIAFAWSMRAHPRFRRLFAVPGLMLGVLILLLNLATFPIPPAEAELVDVGPAVGLWYLAITIRTWHSLPWARERLGRT